MNSTDQVWDVIIIGAGAAGLMAAASAAEAVDQIANDSARNDASPTADDAGGGVRDPAVLVLEKNRKIGVKILMSGGTRCNITHNCSAREIATAFGKQGRFLHSALAALSPEDVIRKIEDQGVATKVESTGKVFPISNRAVDVRDALVELATQAGAVLQTEHTVQDISLTDAPDARFHVRANDVVFRCRKLIITTGGKSYPGCGTTGDGYAWAEKLGHSITRTVPALTPVVCDQSWIHELSGVTISDVRVSVMPSAGSSTGKRRKPLQIARGPLLFTHFGFSGPTVMNVSRAINLVEPADADGLSLHIDFLPSIGAEQFADQLRQLKVDQGKQTISQTFARDFPRRLLDALLAKADVSPDHKHAELSKRQLQRLVDTIKRTELPVGGTLGFKKAEVTAGGVSLKEVDSRNMQSKIVPDLYFAGEILDLDGPIGGFNFQSAFSTGWLAGKSVR